MKKNGNECPRAREPRAQSAHTEKMSSEDAAKTTAELAAATELPPPPEPKRKDKKWRPPHPRKGALTKRSPPRPHRRLADDLLRARIQKLTTRMERAKAQHDAARALLTKYSHEQTYRMREALVEHEANAQQQQHPLPEFPAVESTIPEPVMA